MFPGAALVMALFPTSMLGMACATCSTRGSAQAAQPISAVDGHTFKITLEAYTKLTMPDLAVPLPVMVDPELAKTHATDKDPWAFGWVSRTTAAAAPSRSSRGRRAWQLLRKS